MAELLSPDLGASEPAVFPGSTLSPVVATAPLSVAFLPPEVSLVVPPKSWRLSYAASGLVLDSLIS